MTINGPTATTSAEGGSTAAPEESIGADVVNLHIDHDWLAQCREQAIEPELEIVDAHHHLWDRLGDRYQPPDLIADITGGHNVVATVLVEAGAMFRSSGPEEMRPVGETEMGALFAECATPGGIRLCAGIVSHADLTLGDRVAAILEAHVEAGRGRFRGIRQIAAYDPAPSLQLPELPWRRPIRPGLLCYGRFREGFARLAPLALTFDVWAYQQQIGEVVDLARAFPETQIVVNHVAGPIRVGVYRDRERELFADWRAKIDELAGCANVTMKIGGLGMRGYGHDLRALPRPPDSRRLANLWRHYVEGCIEAFGADRCMFESNFPVDKAYYSYNACWNAFKRLTAGASGAERAALFRDTAARVYRLDAD